MGAIEGVSREFVDCMTKNIFQARKLCQDCRYFLFYSALTMKCANPDSPKYDLDVGKFDSCPFPFWEKKIND
jgi:hypothetical protein